MQSSVKKVIIIAAIIIAVVIAGATIAVGLLLKGNDKPVSSDNPPAVTDVTVSGEDISSMTSGENTVPDTTTENGNNNTPSSSETQATANTPSPESVTKSGLSAGAKLVSSWDNNGQINSQFDITVSNNGSENVSSWTIEFDVPAGSTISGSWNGNYSIAGTVLKITGDQNNSNISAGGTSTTGFIIVSPSAFNINEIRVNGEKVKVDVSSGTGNNNNNNNNNNSNNNGGGTDIIPVISGTADLKRAENAVQGDDWLFAKGNKIVDKNGKEVWLTGCNWAGYNTGTNLFDGLWNANLESSLSSIADHGFNVIRIPISAELINQWESGNCPSANFNQASNPNLVGKNSLQIFDYVVELCEAYGIKIIIDIHSADTDAMGHMTNLWYTSKTSVNNYYRSLEWMAERYKNNDTIIAYDIKNEPHGKPSEGINNMAIWNNSTAQNNWKYTAETAAKKVLAKNPNVLILVEGTESYPKNPKANNFTSTNMSDYYTTWWGGNLRGVKDYPINLGKYQNKLVYSPHDYGPTVYQQPWFQKDFTYNSLMNDCWRDNWFYIYENNTAPLLIGEWGGFMREPNLEWMGYMRQLIKNYKLHHTFWCYQANSGDTGGLVLDDFKTWDTQKYNFVKEVLWQQNGKFVGLDHEVPLGNNGISLSEAK